MPEEKQRDKQDDHVHGQIPRLRGDTKIRRGKVAVRPRKIRDQLGLKRDAPGHAQDNESKVPGARDSYQYVTKLPL